jgi:hypothetical protein
MYPSSLRLYSSVLFLAAASAILYASRTELVDLRRYCARKGIAYEFALALSSVILFGGGAAALWAIVLACSAQYIPSW